MTVNRNDDTTKPKTLWAQTNSKRTRIKERPDERSTKTPDMHQSATPHYQKIIDLTYGARIAKKLQPSKANKNKTKWKYNIKVKILASFILV